MRRDISDVLRRGFESMLANWPLLIIRIVESVAMIVIVILAIVAVIVPMAISIGSGANPFRDVAGPPDSAQVVFDFIMANAAVILYMLVIALVVLTLGVAVHSFVTAGCVRVFVDAMQRTNALPAATRDQMNAFTTQRWMEGGRTRWWAVFWIYNIAWSVALLVILIPLLVVIALVIALHQNAPAAIIIGCVGVFLGILVILPVAVVTGIWTQRAIVDCVARSMDAMDALRVAWREIRADFGRHFVVAVIMFAVTIGVTMVIGSMSSMATLGHQPGLMMIPVQATSSIFNSIVSAAVGMWLLACFSALAVEQP